MGGQWRQRITRPFKRLHDAESRHNDERVEEVPQHASIKLSRSKTNDKGCRLFNCFGKKTKERARLDGPGTALARQPDPSLSLTGPGEQNGEKTVKLARKQSSDESNLKQTRPEDGRVLSPSSLTTQTSSAQSTHQPDWPLLSDSSHQSSPTKPPSELLDYVTTYSALAESDEFEHTGGYGLATSSAEPQPLDLQSDVDFTVHYRPPVVQEVKHRRVHTVYHPTITRSIHYHEHIFHEQPVIVDPNDPRAEFAAKELGAVSHRGVDSKNTENIASST